MKNLTIESLKSENPYTLFNKGGVKFNEKYLDNVELENNCITIINGVEFKAHSYNENLFYFSIKTPYGGSRSNTSQLRNK